MEPFNGGEVSPGPSVDTDEQILDWVRTDGETALHPSCTCRMGRADDDSVVDPLTMNVHGVQGVRVVDASAMRYVTNGNIYAPVMMMAEKSADLIMGNTPLAPEPVDFFRGSIESLPVSRPRRRRRRGWRRPTLARHRRSHAVAVDRGRDLVLLLGGQLELRQEVERGLVLGLETGGGCLVQHVGRVVAGVATIGRGSRRQAFVGDLGQLDLGQIELRACFQCGFQNCTNTGCRRLGWSMAVINAASDRRRRTSAAGRGW